MPLRSTSDYLTRWRNLSESETIMNQQKEIYLTPEGAAKLRAELTELTGPRREELSRRLRSAIQMGDLSENADYHKAKEDQAFLEGRIQEIEAVLRTAVVVEKSSSDVVSVGCTVTV